MAPEPHSDFRYDSGPVVRITMAVLVVGLIGFLIWALLVGHVAGVVVFTLLIAAATGSGLILERVDSSRQREQGTRPGPDEHWGFRGRPGS